MGPGARGIFRQSRFEDEHRGYDRKRDIIIIKRIARSFTPYKGEVIVVFIAIILTTLLGLVNPLMIEFVFDDAIGKHNLNLLVVLVCIMVATPVISGVIGVGQTYLNNLVGQKVMRDLRNNLYAHLQTMPMKFFTATKTGEMQSRLSNDVGGVQSIITDTATTLVSNISTVVSTIIAMAIISWSLTVVSLFLLPFFLFITYKVGKVRRTTSTQTQESLASLSSIMQETLSVSGILLIKTFGRQKMSQAKFDEESEKQAKLQIRQQMIGRWFFMFVGTFFSVIPAIIYLVAGIEIIHSPLHAAITLGGIVAFTTLQSRLFFPIGQLLNLQVEIQGALALFERIFEYLDMKSDIVDTKDPIYLDKKGTKGDLVFDHVSFSYGTTATLHDISFEVQPGQLAALVGPSGAGKTTITYLVPRLYDVTSGRVEIDGNNVKDIALASLGEIVGVVTQETYLFHDTVRENLLYAKPDATEQEIVAATKAAAIHDRIMALDEGYETFVGERGYKLSGGEKQRIAIARVILKDPKILILDEATSALDTHSERLIQQALVPLMQHRTTLAIAHRLSTILAADIILVVDNGRIVESGTHDELLAKNGLYTRLYNEQFLNLPE